RPHRGGGAAATDSDRRKICLLGPAAGHDRLLEYNRAVMKRTERQHLKENELRAFALQAREAIEARRRETTAIVAVMVVIGVAALGFFGWREHVQGKAHALLAEAMAVQDARIGPPPAPGTPANGLYFPTERERAQAALTKWKIAADAY